MIHPCITIPVRPSCSKRQPGYCEERLVSEPASPLSNAVGPKLTLGLSSFHCKLRIGTLQRLNGNVFANTVNGKAYHNCSINLNLLSSSVGYQGSWEHPLLNSLDYLQGTLSWSECMAS